MYICIMIVVIIRERFFWAVPASRPSTRPWILCRLTIVTIFFSSSFFLLLFILLIYYENFFVSPILCVPPKQNKQRGVQRLGVQRICADQEI